MNPKFFRSFISNLNKMEKKIDSNLELRISKIVEIGASGTK